MNSLEYEDPDVEFGDAVGEIFRIEEEEEEEAVLQQVAPPATPPRRTVTPDSFAASSDASEAGDESSSSGAPDFLDVTTHTGLSTVRNVVQQALNNASCGNSGGQSTGATTTTGAPVASSTTTVPVSVPGVATAGIPTTQSVVVALESPVVPGTSASGVPVVQSVASAGLLTAPHSSTVGPASVQVAGGQSAPNTVQPLQGGAGHGVGAVQPPTWVPSGPVPSG
ncbi:hypothetical protein PI124_g12205 [Phytophthora idaei]|nr:hypothetical protein PI125_g18275 [Phytophthora idaei]KAG3152837.1 hypothetical protein PI126_g10351 [Phytophthora idaei]KAG3242970.1 hypothetical protein PI124_g12205 [Phytophthora idaei]